MKTFTLDKAFWNIFKFTNLIWLLLSSFMWIIFFLPERKPLLFVNAIMLLCLPFLGFKITFNRKILLPGIILVIITFYFASIYHLFSYGLLMFCTYFPALILVVLPKQYKVDLLRYITKWYAILMMCSIVLFLLTLRGQLSPPLGVFLAPNDFYEPFYNFGLYLKYYSRFTDIPRFNAFFLEPGHQAIVSFFILMANRMDFKKNIYTITISIAILLSLSLAGYVLCAIAWICLRLKNIRGIIQIMAAFVLFMTGIQLWNGGDNIINETIVSRLSFDEEKGISGNNRFFESTDYLYDVMVRDGDLMTGMHGKADEEDIAGAGYKIYLLHFGLLGALLVLAYYISLIPKNVDRQYALTFLFVIFLCFLQRAYPDWYSWLLPFALGVGINSRKGKRKKALA